MIKFLVARPIAVIMTVLSFAVLGLTAFFTMPVSLLPDIDIPEIIVKVNYPRLNARSLENTVVKPLRQQLMQVSGLKSIESDTRDGSAKITLHFTFSTRQEYAYIETNEKVDDITSSLPRDMERPQVIKKKPSDIPVFFISAVPLKEFFNNENNFEVFGNYIESEVKRRFEQLEEVAMVDITGIVKPQIVIEPDEEKLHVLGLTTDDIVQAIRKENIYFDNLSFREGHFIYQLRFKSSLRAINDFKNIKIFKNGKLILLNDIATIQQQAVNNNGMFYHNGQRAVLLAVYKQSGARTADVSKKTDEIIKSLSKQVPSIKYQLERDQTKLLKYSLTNLKQTLLLGILLAMGIMFLFYRKPQLPVLLVLTIPVSLLVSFFFLYLAKISINIISLSGLILSVGLMIDNSIIVIDNINQYRLLNRSAFDASIMGTNEVIRPLLSSVLTTVAVFVPLVALSGIAGALFYEQAITIVISLTVSYLISIMVLPTLYYVFNKRGETWQPSTLNKKLLVVYEHILFYIMKRKTAVVFGFLLLIPLGWLLYIVIDKQQFPVLDQTDIIATIQWNEPVSLSENKTRSIECINAIKKVVSSSAIIGKPDFLLSDNQNQTITSSTLYLDFEKIINPATTKKIIDSIIRNNYQNASVEFTPSENIFRAIFNPDQPKLTASFYPLEREPVTLNFVKEINDTLEKFNIQINTNNYKAGFSVQPLFQNLLLYNVEYSTLLSKLKLMFGGTVADKIMTGNNYLPVIIKARNRTIYKIFSDEFVTNRDSVDIPLNSLIKYKKVNIIKNISADQKGEYYKIDFTDNIPHNETRTIINRVSKSLKNLTVKWSGSLMHQSQFFNEFLFILVISVVLLYLILAAQFESLLLPFIILIEIIFDIAGSLLLLYILGSSLNVMSLLGIIVMSGIVINDSIIKIDTIKQEIRNGHSVSDAIYIGGKRRFFAIIMTSLTTILALLPLLFYSGMGVELQLPLAIAVIGGLTLGTIISLFFIPVMFYFFARLNIN